MMKWIKNKVCRNCLGKVPEAEYEPFRAELHQAGLSEAKLRKMAPDDRVAALEQAKLDPYDFIFLACG